MELSRKQIQHLKGLAHKLNPAVQTGKAGVTPAMVKEVDRNLEDHELIKVRINVEERAEFLAIAEQLAKDTRSTTVHVIGRIAVFFRPSKTKPKVTFSTRGAAKTEKTAKAPKAAKPGNRPPRGSKPGPAKKKFRTGLRTNHFSGTRRDV